uniref:PBPe domain-containing protein n=1 Tax=Macrostomum lignano TaxID=282301 RepID=A0A1I8GU24_9PLAT
VSAVCLCAASDAVLKAGTLTLGAVLPSRNAQLRSAFYLALKRRQTDPSGAVQWRLAVVDAANPMEIQRAIRRELQDVACLIAVSSELDSMSHVVHLARNLSLPVVMATAVASGDAGGFYMRPSLAPEAALKIALGFGWRQAVYLVNSADGLARAAQAAATAARSGLELRTVYLPATEVPLPRRYLDVPDLDGKHRRRVVVDLEPAEQQVQHLMASLSGAGLNRREFHYLLLDGAAAQLPTVGLLYSGVSVTGLQLLGLGRREVRHGQMLRGQSSMRANPQGTESLTIRMSGPLHTLCVRDLKRRWELISQHVETQHRQREGHGGSSPLPPPSLQMVALVMDSVTAALTAATAAQLGLNAASSRTTTEARKRMRWHLANTVDFVGYTGRITFRGGGSQRRTSLSVPVLQLNSPDGFRHLDDWHSNSTSQPMQLSPDVAHGGGFFDSSDSDIGVGFRGRRNRTAKSSLRWPRLIRVVTIESRPFVQPKTPSLATAADDVGSNDTAPSASPRRLPFEGFCMELLERIAERVGGLKYSVHLVGDGQYGGRNSSAPAAAPEADKWNGMIGELLQDTADVAFAPLTINTERSKVVDFTEPFLTFGISIMIKKPRKEKPGVFGFLQPLSQVRGRRLLCWALSMLFEPQAASAVDGHIIWKFKLLEVGTLSREGGDQLLGVDAHSVHLIVLPVCHQNAVVVSRQVAQISMRKLRQRDDRLHLPSRFAECSNFVSTGHKHEGYVAADSTDVTEGRNRRTARPLRPSMSFFQSMSQWHRSFREPSTDSTTSISSDVAVTAASLDQSPSSLRLAQMPTSRSSWPRSRSCTSSLSLCSLSSRSDLSRSASKSPSDSCMDWTRRSSSAMSPAAFALARHPATKRVDVLLYQIEFVIDLLLLLLDVESETTQRLSVLSVSHQRCTASCTYCALCSLHMWQRENGATPTAAWSQMMQRGVGVAGGASELELSLESLRLIFPAAALSAVAMVANLRDSQGASRATLRTDKVWPYMLTCGAGVIAGLHLCARLSPVEWRITDSEQLQPCSLLLLRKRRRDFSLFNSLWFALASIVNQSVDISPRSSGARLVTSVWWFFTLIMIADYTAILAASLTVELLRTPIESWPDLLGAHETSGMLFGTIASGSTQAFFLSTKIWPYSGIGAVMRSNSDEIPVNTTEIPVNTIEISVNTKRDTREHLEIPVNTPRSPDSVNPEPRKPAQVYASTTAAGVQRVRESNGRYAFLLESKMNEFHNNRDPCDTMMVGQPFGDNGYGVATQRGSPLRELFNDAILQLREQQVLAELYKKWWIEKVKVGTTAFFGSSLAQGRSSNPATASNCPELEPRYHPQGQCATDDSDSSDAGQSPLAVVNVAGVFYILVAGLGAAMAAALVESALLLESSATTSCSRGPPVTTARPSGLLNLPSPLTLSPGVPRAASAVDGHIIWKFKLLEVGTLSREGGDQLLGVDAHSVHLIVLPVCHQNAVVVSRQVAQISMRKLRQRDDRLHLPSRFAECSNFVSTGHKHEGYVAADSTDVTEGRNRRTARPLRPSMSFFQSMSQWHRSFREPSTDSTTSISSDVAVTAASLDQSPSSLRLAQMPTSRSSWPRSRSCTSSLSLCSLSSRSDLSRSASKSPSDSCMDWTRRSSSAMSPAAFALARHPATKRVDVLLYQIEFVIDLLLLLLDVESETTQRLSVLSVSHQRCTASCTYCALCSLHMWQRENGATPTAAWSQMMQRGVGVAGGASELELSLESLRLIFPAAALSAVAMVANLRDSQGASRATLRTDKVWPYMLTCGAGVIAGLHLCARLSPVEWRITDSEQLQPCSLLLLRKRRRDFSLFNSLWFALASIVNQSVDISPRSSGARLVTSVWWFFTLIMIADYTAILAASLTVELLRTPIESWPDLLGAHETSGMLFGTIASGSTQAFFLSTKIWPYSGIGAVMRSNSDEIPVNTTEIPVNTIEISVNTKRDTREHLEIPVNTPRSPDSVNPEPRKPAQVYASTTAAGVQRVRESNGRYAFLLESKMNEFHNNRDPCDTMMVGQPFGDNGYGVATQRGSPLRELFNDAILQLREQQVLAELYKKWWIEKVKVGTTAFFGSSLAQGRSSNPATASNCPELEPRYHPQGQCATDDSDSSDAGQSPLAVVNVAGVFYILVAGLGAAMAAALVES